MRGLKIILILAGASLIGINTQCTYNKWPQPGIAQDTISFNKQLIPLFSSSCISGPCHNASYASYSPSAKFDLDSAVAYYSLVSGPRAIQDGWVNTEHVYYSVLYQQVSQGYMPKPGYGYPLLTSTQIQEILKWIQQGAKNN